MLNLVYNSMFLLRELCSRVGWSIDPGWCLNSSLQRTFVLTSLTMTLDLTVLQHSSRDMATASVPLVRSCLLCQRSLLCLCLFVF